MLRISQFHLSALLLFLLITSCSPETNQPKVEAVSLSGKPLPQLLSTDSATLQNLRTAESEWMADSTSEDKSIWYGRRLSYAGRYNDAVRVFTNALEHNPDSYRLLRHRGHRYITLRKFDDAIADLERAADLTKNIPDVIEPDGLPNALNQPRSTDQTNIWYHLGLAYFLKGNYTKSIQAFDECLKRSTNDDMRVATLDWLYMAQRRMGRKDRAERLLTDVRSEMDIIENTSYHKRLLLYKGELNADSLVTAALGAGNELDLLTQGFGVGHWYLVNGDRGKASRVFQLVTMQKNWAAFGYIAAEAELQRMR